MKYIILVTALFGVYTNAQAPCNGGCLSNCPVDNRCPTTNLLEATLLPHLSDCSKFIKCENGHGCEQDCPPGLHFNEREKACDWPGNSCCDPSVPCGPPATADPPTTTCEANPNCPAVNPLQPVLLPHVQCSKFFKCHNGNACEYDCPSGLHFNAREFTCDWPWRACCDPAVPCDPCPTCPPPQDTTTTTTPMPTTPTSTTPNPTTPEPTKTTPLPTSSTTTAVPTPDPTPGDCPVCQMNCELDTRCPATNIAKPILLPNLAKCSEFFKCETGRACRMICPAGLHFNQKTEVCDWPWNACCDPAITCVKACIPGVTCPPRVG